MAVGERIATTMILAAIASLPIVGCGDDNRDGSGGDSRSPAAASEPEPGTAPATSGSELSDSDSVEPGGQSSGYTGTIPKPEFIEEANAICRQVIENIRTRQLPYLEEQERTGEQNREEVELELAEPIVLAELLNEIDEIEGLGTPPGERDEVRRVLLSFLGVIERAREDPRILVGTDDAFQGAARVAKAYGLDDCPYG